MKLSPIALATLMLVAAMAPAKLFAADVATGEQIAKKCVACHDMTSAQKNKVGPYLWGIAGRGAGKVAGFRYSSALMDKSGSLVWDDSNLSLLITDTKGMIPGSKMAFAGIKDPAQVDNLVAYLKTLR